MFTNTNFKNVCSHKKNVNYKKVQMQYSKFLNFKVGNKKEIEIKDYNH